MVTVAQDFNQDHQFITIRVLATSELPAVLGHPTPSVMGTSPLGVFQNLTTYITSRMQGRPNRQTEAELFSC